MPYIYQVADDREGLNQIIATYDNEEAAEAHRAALAATDAVYGDYFTVDTHKLHRSDEGVKSTFDPDDLYG